MPISSLIIRTDKEQLTEIKEWIQESPFTVSLEAHHDNLVLVTETNSQEEDKFFWSEIERFPGVLQCDLIYHNFEEVLES